MARNKRVTFPSLANAAAALSLQPETLKAAKRSGCPAFKSRGSVDKRELLDWLAAHPDLGAGTLSTKAQIDLEVLRDKRLKNDLKERKLVDRAKKFAESEKVAAEIRTAVYQSLENELPSEVVGHDEQACRVILKRHADRICAKAQALALVWT